MARHHGQSESSHRHVFFGGQQQRVRYLRVAGLAPCFIYLCFISALGFLLQHRRAVQYVLQGCMKAPGNTHGGSSPGLLQPQIGS